MSHNQINLRLGWALGILFLLTSACGDEGSFYGDQSSRNTQTGQAAAVGETPDLPNIGEVSLEDESSEADMAEDLVEDDGIELVKPDKKDLKAIEACKKSWGDAPMPDFSQIRRIKASVSVLGRGTMLRDTEQTSRPVLTVVRAGVNIGGSPTWQLENKNGWYCIDNLVNVKTKLTVKLSRQAKLADSKVAVNVGSNSDQDLARVGVHVGSDITIELVD